MGASSKQDTWIVQVFGVDPHSYAATQAPPNIAASANKATAAAAPSPKTLALLAKDWREARQKAASDIARLQSEIAKDLEGEPDADVIEREFVEYAKEIDQTLGTTLLNVLVTVAKSGGKDFKMISKTVDDHLAFVDGNEVVDVLDTNPILGIGLRATLEAPLRAIKAAIQINR